MRDPTLVVLREVVQEFGHRPREIAMEGFMARTVLKHAKSVDIDRRQLLASVAAMTIGGIGAAPDWAFVRDCPATKELNDPAAEVKAAKPSDKAYWFTGS